MRYRDIVKELESVSSMEDMIKKRKSELASMLFKEILCCGGRRFLIELRRGLVIITDSTSTVYIREEAFRDMLKWLKDIGYLEEVLE